MSDPIKNCRYCSPPAPATHRLIMDNGKEGEGWCVCNKHRGDVHETSILEEYELKGGKWERTYGKTLKIQPIKDGTVIDHITPGHTLTVLKMLGITGKEGYTVSFAMNVPSRKYGSKDLVMLEGVHLNRKEVDKIAIIAPHATVNDIRDGIKEKYRVKSPEIATGLFRCDETCVSGDPREPVYENTKFIRVDPPEIGRGVSLEYECYYCGRRFDGDELIKRLII